MRRPILNAMTPVIGVAMLIGHLTTWAQHKTAALSLTGHELGEFTNFTPGAGVFANEWFYVPVWAGGLALALAAARARRPSTWLTLMAAAVASAQFGLPRFERWSNPEFRLQFAVTVACLVAVMGLGIGLRLAKRADGKASGLVMTALPLLTVVPLVGFLVVRPFIEALYRDAVTPGIGWWLCLAASLAAGAQTLFLAREALSGRGLVQPGARP
ncbi:MAG: hypothetical protein ABIQ99_17075 [Thermoflexales bacterium]